MKKYIILLAIVFGPMSYAEKPDWITVPELYIKSIDTKDKNYMSTVHSRCGALWTVIAGISGEYDDNYESFLNLADSHFSMSNKYAFRVIIERGGSEEDFPAKKKNMLYVSLDLAKKYSDWMNDNWTKTGDHIGSDEELKSDMEFCGTLIQIKDDIYDLMVD